MLRTRPFFFTVLAGAFFMPQTAAGQAAHDAMASHDHSSPAVDCATLATPPWSGLSVLDRERFEEARASVSDLITPEAALAAGFRPALGDIPGMGVHYVHADRSEDGIHVDQPDHLMFAPVDGEPTLVGAAYAFVDVPETQEPLPYDSDLAHWHDHPQFAPDGQTLHMLHVWFVPSSNGPFAGLNFWLPFHGQGITPPSACWMSDDMMARMIQRVAFALVPADNPIASQVTRARGWTVVDELPLDRQEILDELDAAAEAEDMQAWMRAGERFLGNLTERERLRTGVMLELLMNEQMSSMERTRGGNG
ncbi:MAG: hypothetical protein ACPGPI_05565 [Longimicrobiales bacterium]